ncbi:uncharacterized protein LOC117101231 isoform X3 [Anneissia japonica]|uniref:uncharacterized protein LOC117101231 isoform X3 n=1 Tax=Anneissia japonica TaxID=1529436 RepID=UPI00142556C2|nr:uncharacterized protein LOC117101231 isoform X3 [Anneissia japonica]
MSFQATCIDGFLSDRLCSYHVPLPVWNSSLPPIPDNYTTTIFRPTSEESTTIVTGGRTTLTTVYPTTTDLGTDLPNTIISKGGTIFTDLATTEDYNITTNATITPTVPICNDMKGTEHYKWIIPLVCIFILCIICIKFRVKIRIIIIGWFPQKQTITFREEKKVKMRVRVTSIVLEPKTNYEDCHTVVMASTEKLNAETPGTPIINAPRGFYKDNYEDIPSSSDENEDTNLDKQIFPQKTIIRENSQAPLVDNAVSLDETRALDNGYADESAGNNGVTETIQTISSGIGINPNYKSSSSDDGKKPGIQKKRVSRGKRNPAYKLAPIKKPNSHGHFVKKSERAQDIGHANVEIPLDKTKL